MSNSRDMVLALKLRADVQQALGEIKRANADVRGLGNAGEAAGKKISGLSGVFQSLRTVLIGAGLAATARAYITQADSAANLAGRLRLVTKSQVEFTNAMRDTYALAQQSGAQWRGVVDLYASLAQTTELTHEQIVALGSAVSKSFQISNAGPQDMANGMRQLQQAIAGGVLRAEEFNSIVDTAPRIVQALADHFGIAFRQVREYVNEGKVSSDDLIQALLDAGVKIDAEYGRLPLTVQRATQQVENAFMRLIGGADSASGASSGLAKEIVELARTLESPEVASGLSTFMVGVVKLTGALAEGISQAANFAKGVGEAFAEKAYGSTDPVERIYEQINKLKEMRENRQIQLLAQTKDGIGGGLERLLGVPAEKLIADIEEINQQIDELQKKADSLKDIRPASAAPTPKPEATPPKKNNKPSGPTEEELKAAQSARESMQKISAQLDEQVNTFGAGEQAVLSYRLTIGGLADEVKRLGPEGARMRDQIIEQAGALEQLQRAAKAAEEAERERERAALEAERARKAIEDEGMALKQALRTAQEQYNDELERYRQLLSAGAIDQETFNRAVTAAGERLKEASKRGQDANKLMESFAENAAKNIQSSFADFLFDPFDGGLKGMVKSFADTMRRMAAEALALDLLGSLTKPGAKGGASAFATFFASVLHSGGRAGDPGGATRAVSPLLFVGAPRYHDGFLPGLKPNEKPAIITADEAVLTRDQQTAISRRLADSGGSGGAVAIEIGMTEGLFAQMIDGPAGSRALLRFARRNRAAFKEALG